MVKSWTKIVLILLMISASSERTTAVQGTNRAINTLAWSPDGNTVIASITIEGSADLWSVDLETFAATNLTNTPTTYENLAAWSPDGQFVAYLALEDAADLWIMQPDGSEPQNLTIGLDSTVLDFQWSFDSTQIIFSVIDPETATGSAIWMLDVESFQLTQLVEAEPGSGEEYLLYSNPTLSPDGSQVSFKSDDVISGLSELLIADLQENEIGDIETIFESEDFIREAYWSPDGDQIVVSTLGVDSAELYIVNLDGETSSPTEELGRLNGSPRWSPDGNYLAFTSSPPVVYESDIYVLELETNAITDLTGEGIHRYDQYPAWSPDSQRLIFVSESNEVDSLWIVDIATGELSEVRLNLDI
ncbi:MAG: DPP IV N-terminal domain-containing protein [Chloroflexi bacterium]|nr:DPP IV N-terminal domain-containing protein [Chloroflexota bacterium]